MFICGFHFGMQEFYKYLREYFKILGGGNGQTVNFKTIFVIKN